MLLLFGPAQVQSQTATDIVLLVVGFVVVIVFEKCLSLCRGVADGQVGPVLTGLLFGQTEFFSLAKVYFHPWSPCTSISAI